MYMYLAFLPYFQVLLSTRTGAWVINRSSDGGYPFNMMVLRRHHNFIAQGLPSCILKWIQERHLNKRFDHANYGLNITKGYLIIFLFNGKVIWSVFLILFNSELKMSSNCDFAFVYPFLSLFS